MQWRLTLGNIGECILGAEDDDAGKMVEALAQIMRLPSFNKDSEVSIGPRSKQFDIHLEGSFKTPIPAQTPLVIFRSAGRHQHDIVTVRGVDHSDLRTTALRLISSGMAIHFESLGGGLLHGALIVRNGNGIILVGPSQIGKSTACSRLPEGWKALSDDAALIVPSSPDTYVAHPWPTWSRLMDGGPGGSWDVSSGIPLRSIFFLTRGEKDHVSFIGQGEAACALVKSMQQINHINQDSLPDTSFREINSIRFNNVCTIARRINSWQLAMSPKGQFHDLIDQILETDPLKLDEEIH